MSDVSTVRYSAQSDGAVGESRYPFYLFSLFFFFSRIITLKKEASFLSFFQYNLLYTALLLVFSQGLGDL